MKIIALGDTHGRRFWKTVVNNYGDQADKVVFIGDYFDSWDIGVEQQVNNFLDICAYKRANPYKVEVLIGNHDFHYTSTAMSIGEVYEGFNSQASPLIKAALAQNQDILKAAFQHEEWLFTHAGVTSTWIKRTMNLPDSAEIEFAPGMSVADYINAVYQRRPALFFFVGRDPYGNSVESSPLWVRPEALTKNAFQYETLKQVVGHTSQDTIRMQKNRFFFIDAVAMNQFLIIDNGVAEPVQITYQDYEERQREERKPWQKHKHDDDEMVP